MVIRAVFFDFYNTLVRFCPPAEEIQVQACRELGVSVNKSDILRGYSIADDFFNRENSRSTLTGRSEEGRNEFFAHYEQMILKGAGLEVSLRLAREIWQFTTMIPKFFTLFDDVDLALRRLSKKGYTLGVLSNLDADMDSLIHDLGLEQYLDFCITSRQVGAGKPHAPIFLAALTRAGVNPQEAAHVGDQYHSDVEGARANGLTPILLDREGFNACVNDCHKICDLLELESVVSRLGSSRL